MNLDDLTIADAKKLACMVKGLSDSPRTSSDCCHPMVGKHCVIRTYSAGVHIGIVKAVDGMEVVLENAFRLWSWSGAFSLHEVAIKGVAKESKVSCEIEEIYLTQAVEFLPTTKEARKTYENCTKK